MKKIFIALSIMILASCTGQERKVSTNNTVIKTTVDSKVKKPDSEWKKILTQEQFDVLRNKATERPFTGEFYKHFEEGVYVCAGCGNPLFKSDAKFDSACGWPSFDQAIEKSVTYKEDSTFGMSRTEVMCANCGGHLGHVFDDGPKETTGNRFCTNSVSIKFIPAAK